MIKPLASQLQREARAGAHITVSAGDYLAFQLASIARAAKDGGGSLTVRDADKLLSSQRASIAQSGRGVVHFDVS